MMKVCVAIPMDDTCKTDFTVSLVKMCMHRGKHAQITALATRRNSVIAQSRCQLVEQAREAKADAILMVDSDMTFPSGTLDTLAEADKDIIGANCVARRAPFMSNVIDLEGKRMNRLSTGIEEVAAIGTGVILIKMSVFDRIEKPYFLYDYNDGQWIGEDFYFCTKAAGANIPMHVHHDLSKQIGHIGSISHTIGQVPGGS